GEWRLPGCQLPRLLIVEVGFHGFLVRQIKRDSPVNLFQRAEQRERSQNALGGSAVLERVDHAIERDPCTDDIVTAVPLFDVLFHGLPDSSVCASSAVA